MIRLGLTPNEASALKEILASYLSDLRMEIADTDSMAFREGLKQRELFLKRLIDELEEGLSVESSHVRTS
jgi:hypothetical protein